MGDMQIAARLAEPFGSFPQIIADNAAALGNGIALRDDDGDGESERVTVPTSEAIEAIAAIRLMKAGRRKSSARAVIASGIAMKGVER